MCKYRDDSLFAYRKPKIITAITATGPPTVTRVKTVTALERPQMILRAKSSGRLLSIPVKQLPTC